MLRSRNTINHYILNFIIQNVNFFEFYVNVLLNQNT